MNAPTLILKNLTRNRLRMTLTILAIALPMFVFIISRSFVDGINQFLVQSDLSMRVAVHQKLTYAVFLPQRIRGEIESMAPEGFIKGICSTAWFGGRLPDKQMNFPNAGVDRDTFHLVWDDYNLTPEEIERFQNERRGAVVAEMLARSMNWRVGDRVTLTGSIPPYMTLEFLIVAIRPEISGPWLYFGLDYYDEMLQQATGTSIGVNNFWMKLNSPEARRWALKEIDAHFANSEYETRTELESTFLSSFIRSGGDWVGMVWDIGRLIVLVAVAVAFNTMSMAFRERTRELAVLRALGFQASRIVGMVMAEGLALGLIGGLLAVAPVYFLTNLAEIVIPGVEIRVRISEPTAFVGLGVAVLCGLLAALAPAVMAGRLQIASALRKVV